MEWIENKPRVEVLVAGMFQAFVAQVKRDPHDLGKEQIGRFQLLFPILQELE